MSKALKKQMCYAAGTLAGWGLAKATNAKETVPFTILGGLLGFAVSETMFGADPTVMAKPYVADKRKDDELSGTSRKRRPRVSLVHSAAFTDAERRAMNPGRRKRKTTKKRSRPDVAR